MRVDLNSDLGESFGAWKMGDDEAMLGIITSASVACGWHAGDPVVMHRAAELAKQNGVAIGVGTSTRRGARGRKSWPHVLSPEGRGGLAIPLHHEITLL